MRQHCAGEGGDQGSGGAKPGLVRLPQRHVKTLEPLARRLDVGRAGGVVVVVGQDGYRGRRNALRRDS